MSIDQRKKTLRLGIVGGGPASWIGHVHRIAARLTINMQFVPVSFQETQLSQKNLLKILEYQKIDLTQITKKCQKKKVYVKTESKLFQ